jgi:hypothetical protein
MERSRPRSPAQHRGTNSRERARVDDIVHWRPRESTRVVQLRRRMTGDTPLSGVGRSQLSDRSSDVRDASATAARRRAALHGACPCDRVSTARLASWRAAATSWCISRGDSDSRPDCTALTGARRRTQSELVDQLVSHGAASIEFSRVPHENYIPQTLTYDRYRVPAQD